eukprot:6213678-Pleurochrysis_carterae.AAC.5
MEPMPSPMRGPISEPIADPIPIPAIDPIAGPMPCNCWPPPGCRGWSGCDMSEGAMPQLQSKARECCPCGGGCICMKGIRVLAALEGQGACAGLWWANGIAHTLPHCEPRLVSVIPRPGAD